MSDSDIKEGWSIIEPSCVSDERVKVFDLPTVHDRVPI